MSERLSDLELEAWRDLLLVHRQVVKRLDEEMVDQHRLTLSSYEVLLLLAHAPRRALRMSELAERALLSRSGITRLVDGLEERGLVARRTCPSDARGQLAVLSEKGLEQLRVATGSHLRGIRQHFTGKLCTEELAALASILGRALDQEPSTTPANLSSSPR